MGVLRELCGRPDGRLKKSDQIQNAKCTIGKIWIEPHDSGSKTVVVAFEGLISGEAYKYRFFISVKLNEIHRIKTGDNVVVSIELPMTLKTLPWLPGLAKFTNFRRLKQVEPVGNPVASFPIKSPVLG